MEVYYDDNKALPEKKHKRRVKTASQVEALEKFYNERKYPTESMKSELAQSVGLTEKQISGWFCHRRLKDKRLLDGEVYAHGRQDRSSGVIQDRASGLKQDSCGSTKQGDYRHCDAREVESRRLTGQDLSAADHIYQLGSQYTGNYSGSDDTTSGSSSPLRDSSFPQNTDPFGMANSRCLTKNGNILPIEVKGAKARPGPSGYLKVKGQLENTAVSSVKRQLGRQYRVDGPPLGVEFQPLPPGAFESPIRDPINEPDCVGEPILPHSCNGSRIHKQPNPGTRYKGYNSKMSSHNSDLDETSFKRMRGSDHHENYSHHQSKRKRSLSTHCNPFPEWNSSMEMNEDYAGETSVYDSRDYYGMRAKHDVGEMRMDSVSGHHLRPCGIKVTSEQAGPSSPKIGQRDSFVSKSSKLMLKHGESLDLEDREPSRRMPKDDELCGERTEINEYGDLGQVQVNPENVAKRVGDTFPQERYVRKALMGEMLPWTNQIRRSAAEIPSSFSEDETAEISSSVD